MERAQFAIHLKKKKRERERTKLMKERERERKGRKKDKKKTYTLNQSSASFVERNRWLSAVRHSQTFPLVIEQ